MPQRLSRNMLLVKVLGFRNNPVTEQSPFSFSNFFLQADSVKPCLSVSWFHSKTHFISSNRIWILTALKQIIIYFWLSQFSGSSTATAAVSGGSASRFLSISSTTVEVAFSSTWRHRSRVDRDVLKRGTAFISNQLEELNFRNRICVQSVQQEIQLTFGQCPILVMLP